jgi:hypothetical protein
MGEKMLPTLPHFWDYLGSFWGRCGLKWSYIGSFSRNIRDKNAPDQFSYWLGWSGQIDGQLRALNS